MKVIVNIIYLFLLLILGCSSIKESECKLKEIDGLSTVVGNEPFTNIAIITNQQNVYLINAPEEIKKLLLNNQGHSFKIRYIDERDSADIHIIKAIDASKL